MGLPWKIGGDTREQAHNENQGAKGTGGGAGVAESPAFAPVFIHFFNIPPQVLLQRDAHCEALNGRL